MLSRVPPAITPPFFQPTGLRLRLLRSARRRGAGEKRERRCSILDKDAHCCSCPSPDTQVIPWQDRSARHRATHPESKAMQTLSNVHGKACEAFFKRHTVFTAEAFHVHLAGHGTKPSAQQCIRILREYVEAGRLHPLRPGAYLSRTTARSLDQEPVTNLIQIAAHMTPDAVLAYHTALECYGLAYSVWFHALYAARNPAEPLRLATGLVRGTPFPNAEDCADRASGDGFDPQERTTHHDCGTYLGGYSGSPAFGWRLERGCPRVRQCRDRRAFRKTPARRTAHGGLRLTLEPCFYLRQSRVLAGSL